MATTSPHLTVARGFFLLLGVAVFYLFWQILQPFVTVLVTAAIFAILLTPFEKRLRHAFGRPWLSAAVVVGLAFLVAVGPLATAVVIAVQQAVELAQATVANQEWLAAFSLASHPLMVALPEAFQKVILSVDVRVVAQTAASWAQANLGSIFSSSASFIFNFMFFFICLFFFLMDREKVMKELLSLSPFHDKVDRAIAVRLVETVRGVVFGSLIVATIQGILAMIGLTIFGVPGALIWGAAVIVAAQVPMVGTSVVMVPAIAYLFLTGNVGAGIGLSLWAGIAVGLIDNVLQPYIVGGRTRMHALLILIAMLGGVNAFGVIGFILGPTILAAVLVMVELYKAGILEKRDVA
jgi:predicted PurR-regulated permease PerM